MRFLRYEVSAEMFGFMTRQLMTYAGGKVVLALEGGYNLASISDAAEHCVKVCSYCKSGPEVNEIHS